MKRLSVLPAREDLTDRECAKILGSLIGGLVQMAPAENVRAAVRWWAETDEAWPAIEETANQIRSMLRNGGGVPS